MTLDAVSVDTEPPAKTPARVLEIIAEAERRIEAFDNAHASNPLPAFVASDFALAHHVLEQIVRYGLAPGNRFCEWGSGFGVVTLLAAELGLTAYGIEIEPELIDESNLLADEFGVNAEFICGSMIPTGVEVDVNYETNIAWLDTNGASAYDELELDIDDFDIVYAYPWPGEELTIDDLFWDHAARGALLVTFLGAGDISVQRKK